MIPPPLRPVRLVLELDRDTLARILYAAGPSQATTAAGTRAAVEALLAECAVAGARREFAQARRNTHRVYDDPDPGSVEHRQAVAAVQRRLAWCGELIDRAYRGRRPRPPKERPTPQGRALIDVLAPGNVDDTDEGQDDGR